MTAAPDIWKLVEREGAIDAMEMLRALAQQPTGEADIRSKILRRDAFTALEKHWGRNTLRQRAESIGAERLLEEDMWVDPIEGSFKTIARRLVDATKPEKVMRMLRELGDGVQSRVSVTIGGSLA